MSYGEKAKLARSMFIKGANECLHWNKVSVAAACVRARCNILPSPRCKKGCERATHTHIHSMHMYPFAYPREQSHRAGVIMYNLVDILIYKQSLMKFLLFINNTLSPLENVNYGAASLCVFYTFGNNSPLTLKRPVEDPTLYAHPARWTDLWTQLCPLSDN
jgi:hypothetical protein